MYSISTTTQSRTTSAMTQPARRTVLPGHVVVIICSLTIQLSNLARSIHLEQDELSFIKIGTTVLLGLTFLGYPLLGYIADVCLTRYRTLKCSFIFLIVGCTIGLLLFVIIIIFASLTNKFDVSINYNIIFILPIILINHWCGTV